MNDDIEAQLSSDVIVRSTGLLTSQLRARAPLKKWKRSSDSCRNQLNHNAYHVVMALLIPYLIQLIQAEYQTRPIPPFTEHPINMWSFLISTFLYTFCVIASNILHHHHYLGPIIYTILLTSAMVSALSLALVFFHCSATWVFCILSTVTFTLVTRRYLISKCKSAFSGCSWPWIIRVANQFLRA